MFMLLMSFAVATPIPVEPCGAYIDGWYPTRGEQDVPVDVAPAYLLQTCAEGSGEALVRVTDAAGEVVYSEVVQAPVLDVVSGLQAVDLPQLELLPHTLYEVSVESAFFLDQLSFTTGERRAAAPTQTPSVRLDEGLGWPTTGGFQSHFSGQLNPRDAFVRLVSDDLPAPVAFAFGYASFEFVHPEREVCFTPELRGEDGTWLPGEQECVVIREITEPPPADRSGPFRGLGCSTVDGETPLRGPLSLSWLRRRR